MVSHHGIKYWKLSLATLDFLISNGLLMYIFDTNCVFLTFNITLHTSLKYFCMFYVTFPQLDRNMGALYILFPGP